MINLIKSIIYNVIKDLYFKIMLFFFIFYSKIYISLFPQKL